MAYPNTFDEHAGLCAGIRLLFCERGIALPEDLSTTQMMALCTEKEIEQARLLGEKFWPKERNGLDKGE